MKKRVLLICPYSYPSACGIWKRVENDAQTLIESGYDVAVFSSNILKGTNKTLPKYEFHSGIHIFRFKSWFSFGANSRFFFFPFKFFKIRPHIVHVHGYRHPHSIQGLILGKFSFKKVLITTHAPFGKDPRRSILIKLFDFFYDILIGWWELHLYTKIIRVSQWELAGLKRLFVREKRTIYIPNGIDKEFLIGYRQRIIEIEKRIRSTQNEESYRKSYSGQPGMGDLKSQVLYMGRLDPVKRLEWVKGAANALPSFHFKIVGPLSGYKSFKSNSDNLEVVIEKYDKYEFIQEAQNSDIYVIPSIRETFGITALEAMSQGNIVVSSKTQGVLEYVEDGENGFIAENQKDFIERIRYIYENWSDMQDIRINAIETARKFSISEINLELRDLYDQLIIKN